MTTEIALKNCKKAYLPKVSATLSFRKFREGLPTKDMFYTTLICFISNIGKCQFNESTIRGGISITCKGYAEAKNKFLKSYNTNKPA